MKKKLLTMSLLAASLFGVSAQSQEKKEISLAEHSNISVLRENLVRNGMPYRMADERVRKTILNEQNVSLRNRLATPPDSSIWVDRDPDNFATNIYHPVYHNYTPEQLVKKVLLTDSRAENAISNVKFKGEGWNEATGTWTADDRSLHYFENGQYLGIEKGLLLATGPALEAEGPNTSSGQMDGGTYVTGDPDLSKICSAVTSGSVLEFDFVPYTTRATFDFIFVSDEYGDWSNKHSVNDAFGFFVSKTNNPTDTINIAKFPNDSLVTISNSNWGYRGCETKACYAANPADTTGYSAALIWNSTQNGYYVPNGSPIAVNPQWHIPNPADPRDGGAIMTYDGQTIKLEAVAENLTVGESYHLKLAICNKGDNAYGSAVFLSNLNLGIPTANVEIGYNNIESIDSLDVDSEGEALSMYTGCTYDIEMKFTPSTPSLYPVDVEIDYINIDSTAVINNETGKQLETKFQLENVDDTIREYTIRCMNDYPNFENGQNIGMIVRIIGGGEDTVFYKRLYDTLSFEHQYTMPTEVNKGRLSLNIKTGNHDLLYRSIDGGKTFKPISAGFTQWELLQIGDSCDILLYRPHSCEPIYDTLKIRMATGPIVVRHYIEIPYMNGITTIPNVGYHYVEGHQDFPFYAKFNGSPLTVQAISYYSKDTITLDGIYQENGLYEGSYKYIIEKVTQPWTVMFTTTLSSGEGEVSNDIINRKNVWANGNTLYINSENGNASIYTLTGVLYKQVPVSGSARIQLPSGFYIVSINGKQYKIMIK